MLTCISISTTLLLVPEIGESPQEWATMANALRNRDVVFGVGPAGVMEDVSQALYAALAKGEVKRIILTRPAVEAGEN